MVQSKKGNMIISLILAVILWMYVVGEMNPVTTKSYRDIPVTLTNSQTLSDNGLAVVGASDETMTITLSGKRNSLSKIKTADIVATVDLSDATEGDNQLKINLSVPDSAEVKNQSLTKITVTVEKKQTVRRNIRVKYTGNYAKGEEPTTIKTDPENVTVSGARSLVNKVAYVKATISSDNVSTDETSTSSNLVPVDKHGNEVENIDLSQNTAKITSALYYTKTVSLKVPVTNSSSDGYKRTTTAPEKVKIKGPDRALKKVDSITADTIDVTGITKSTDVDIAPNLPDQIWLSDDSRDLVLNVKVTSEMHSREFTFDGDSVDLNNVGSDLSGNVKTGTVTVTVTGIASKINKISKSDISLSADCDGLGSGTHSVSLTVKCDGTYTGLAADPSKINVRLE